MQRVAQRISGTVTSSERKKSAIPHGYIYKEQSQAWIFLASALYKGSHTRTLSAISSFSEPAPYDIVTSLVRLFLLDLACFRLFVIRGF